MGSIRGIIKDFSGEDDLAQAQREAVNSLAALAMSKADNFDLEIKSALRTAGQLDNQTIPISPFSAASKKPAPTPPPRPTRSASRSTPLWLLLCREEAGFWMVSES